MSSHDDAERHIAGLGKQLQPLAAAVHRSLVGLGCTSYVKTIYVGYDVAGEIVAASYGRGEHVEVAIALPEDATDKILVDAGHLTWRTLPVAAIIGSLDDIAAFDELAAVAVERVRSRQHRVHRDNEFFARARRERHR